MKTKVKRLWSLLLAVVMVFAVMPGPALAAAAEETQGVEAAEEILPDATVIKADEPVQTPEADGPAPLDSAGEASEKAEPVVSAEEPTAEEPVASKAADSEECWSFDEKTGTLTLTGDVPDRESNDPKPWADVSEKIKAIYAENVSIGGFAFSEMTVERVELKNCSLSQRSFGSDVKNAAIDEVVITGTELPSNLLAYTNVKKSITVSGGTINAGALPSAAHSASPELQRIRINDAALTSQAVSGAPAREIVITNVGTIPTGAITGNPNLTSLRIEGADKIDSYAIKDNDVLSTLEVENVDTLESYFVNESSGYAALETISLKQVKLLNGSYPSSTEFHPVISGLQKLKTITMEDVETLNEWSIYYCPALEKITLEDAETLGKYSISSCASLKEISLTDVDTLEGFSIWSCPTLEKITLDDVDTLKSFCIYDCGNPQGEPAKITGLKDCSYIGGYAIHGGNVVWIDQETDLPGADTQIGWNEIFVGNEDIEARMTDILDDEFDLDPAKEAEKLTVAEKWEDSKSGKQNKTAIGGNQITKAARWTNSEKTSAEVEFQFTSAESPMDFLFLVDLSKSMADLGNEEDLDARFYAMQSKLLDVTGEMLGSEGYDINIAVVTFGGYFNGTQGTFTKSNFDGSAFTNDAEAMQAYLMDLKPYYQNTDYKKALNKANEVVQEHQNNDDLKNRKLAVILISDGMPTVEGSASITGINWNTKLNAITAAAKTIKDAGVEIFGVMQSVPEEEEAWAETTMQSVCTDGLFFKASDTDAFSKAVNNAIGAAWGVYTLTDTVDPAFTLREKSIEVTCGTYEVSEDADKNTVITWTILSNPFVKNTMTYKMDLKQNSDDSYPVGIFDTNEGDAPVKKGTQEVNRVETPKLPRGDVPEPDPIEHEWETSKSKTATNLDENFESKVTLSLPAAEEQLVSDVVFVLDKSTSATVEQQALDMLTDLKDQINNNNAAVKVGVVIFNKQANVANNGKFFDLSAEYEGIKVAIEQKITSGTNTHAGLLAGKQMLDDDTAVAADRKYLIFVSDGITYMYNEEPTVTAWSFNNPNAMGDWHGTGSWTHWAGPDNWYSKYHTKDAPENWDRWMTDITSQIDAQGTTYEYPYGGTATNCTAENRENWDTAYAMSIDKALYLTNEIYQAAKSEGYHCYAMAGDSDASRDNPWATSFMNYLANGKAVSFADIQNDIYYLLGAGSKVEDYIGYVADDYNFDFVNDAAKLSMKVGDKSYAAEKIADNKYGFKPVDGDYAYTLTYVKGNGKGEEHFVWAINEPVSQFAPVQLTYTVKLMNPKTADGTYGEYDEDGSKERDGLYTNNSATLYPIDSNGNKVKEEEFPKPTVSYTVTTEPVGTLHISKYVADENAVVGQLYTFEVTVGDETKTVYLTNGETAKWPNIPLGTEYSVKEIDSKGYKATYYHETGKITDVNPDVAAAVVNVPADEGALVISKTVNGNDQDLDKAFKFTITLDQDVGEVSYSGSDSGKMTFMEVEEGKYITSAALANGQTISINNLPAGVRYTVEEAAEDGYTTTISGHDAAEPYEGAEAEGTIVKGSAAVVHFTNTYHKKPVDPPTPPVEKYDIDVAKSVDDSRPEVGDTVTYTVKIKNTGDKKLTDIKVEDVMKKAAGSIKVDENKLPSGVEYEGDGEFTINELAAGKTITIKYTYKVKSADEDETIKNTVTAKANGVSDSDDASIRVRDDDDDDDDDDRPSKSSKSSKPKLDTEDHYAYIVGMPDGLVHPEAEITRAEVATIFYRLLTEESRKALWTKENPYSDVTPNDWYNVAVSVMSNGGVIHGYPDGAFKGGSSITRAEFATIAAQFLSSKYAGSDRFTDISGHWAAEYINRAAAEGWIAGYPDGTFRPDQNITRAEAMTLVNAVLGRTPDKDHLLRNMIEWPDNMVESKWYYAQVQEATNSHEYERGSKKTAEDWTKLLEVRDWLEIERVWSDIYSSHNPGEVMAD